MSGVIEWGAGIDGPTMKALSLPGDTPVRNEDASGVYEYWDFDGLNRYHLPVDHPYYLATSKGFTYWPGGDTAPDDWDGGEVLFAGGQNGPKTGVLTGRINFWQHGNIMRQWNIIGYKRKAAALDFTKPIQTRDGKSVRILCTDGPNTDFPVVGFIEGNSDVSFWPLNGFQLVNYDHSLINAPDVRVKWYGFDEVGSGAGRYDRTDLDEHWQYHLRITWTDGVPKADIFEAGEPE